MFNSIQNNFFCVLQFQKNKSSWFERQTVHED